AGTCYAFNMYDSYGDGLSDPANGSYEVKDAAGTSIASGGGNFGFLAEHFFETSGGAAASWDCDIVNGCIDPGTGTGQYTSLGACTSVCNITSIQDNNTSEFNIYPNPAKDFLIIDGIYNSVNIYDVFGKLVLTSKSQKTIDVSTLNNGVYFVNINSKNTITFKKITVAN
ncbi:T9SS type A sorting domain-containing protein, partial [Flavobacteriales bacterium]|nr:T9SS type A sorting domain-containing protein [Flavobacteriales bacterium]